MTHSLNRLRSALAAIVVCFPAAACDLVAEEQPRERIEIPVPVIGSSAPERDQRTSVQAVMPAEMAAQAVSETVADAKQAVVKPSTAGTAQSNTPTPAASAGVVATGAPSGTASANKPSGSTTISGGSGSSTTPAGSTPSASASSPAAAAPNTGAANPSTTTSAPAGSKPPKKPGLISPELLNRQGAASATSNRRRTTAAPSRPGAN